MTLRFNINDLGFPKLKFNLEYCFLLLIWLAYFSSINVRWTKSWISTSFLPDIAPHIAIAIPVVFLMNVYWLIPTFLNRKKWHVYVLLSLGMLVFYELSRAAIFSVYLSNDEPFIQVLATELTGRNSLVLGELNFLTINFFIISFFFRFTRDWIVHQSTIKQMKTENSQLKILTRKVRQEKIYKDSFIVKKKNSQLLLRTANIVFFKAQGDFVLAMDNELNKHILNDSLKRIYTQLNPDLFFQINRSEIVNYTYIKGHKSFIKNRLEVILNCATQTLYTSNSRTPRFREWLKR